MKTIKTLQAALVAAIVAMTAGCANDPLIDPTNPDTPQGKPMTITVNMPADNAQTRVAFDGSDLSLKWQAGDKLTVKHNNQSAEFTISNISDDGKSASFSGTDPNDGGTGSYTITYAGTNMTEQKQTTNGNTEHLKERIYLEATAASLTDNFTLAMKSSIMKFVLSGTQLADIGDLRYLTWRAEGTKTNSSILCIDGCTFDSNTLTAYMGFMPQDMTIKADGRFIVELMGSSKTYKAEVTIAAGKTYDAGSQYTATIDGTATTAQWEKAPSNVMKFTVKVDATNGLDFRVPFNVDGSTHPAEIEVDWGDGTKPLVVDAKTPLNDDTTFDHRYTTAGTYQITITSDQVDPTQSQIPKFNFLFRSTNNNPKKLISMDTPLLCTDGLYFDDIFNNCTSLTSVPAGLFDKNTKVTSFYYCFLNCTSLTSVPPGLFDKNTEVTSFQYCFIGCTSLTSIPPGLFDKNTKVTNFQSCFSGCASLASVPEGLFDKNTLATNFYCCFYDCTSLVLNEHIFSATANKDRFKNMDMDLTYCFCNVGGNLTPEQKAKSKAPDLWNYGMGTGYWAIMNCYTGCNASNDWTGMSISDWGIPAAN